MYAKATKRPWQTKTKNNEELVTERQLRPGNCVAVDMLHSPTPGLIAQLKGRLAKLHYNYATVYVDVASRYGYIVLQTMASAAETIQCNKAFERHATN